MEINDRGQGQDCAFNGYACLSRLKLSFEVTAKGQSSEKVLSHCTAQLDFLSFRTCSSDC